MKQRQPASLGRIIITPIILLVAGYLVAGLLGMLVAGVVGIAYVFLSSARG